MENGKDLADIIKGVHEKLRKSFVSCGDFNEVWNDHLADDDLRKKYASAMVKLATKVWNDKESRIQWTYETCVDYFLNGGIEQSILRTSKLQQKWSPTGSICDDKLSYLIQVSRQENNYKNLNRKLKLLDVGSCYNPFSKFPLFSCVAIDLTPATEDVIQCDFLKLEIKNPSNDLSCCDINEMFYTESFDIVVFSLVLEYLPAKEQRIEFCSKAWELLQQNGLLIIITPDSKSLQHNAPMMKSWKAALEKLGFMRIKYNKFTHLHCMAFRKVSSLLSSRVSSKSIAELMYIPQDFKKYEDLVPTTERSENENYSICQQFSELPNEH